MVPNTEMLSGMKLGTPVLPKEIMCRQCRFFGYVAKESAGKELRECIKLNDKKIGRGKRKIRRVDSLRDNWRKGIEKNLKLADSRLEWRRKIKDFECKNNET